MKKGVKYEILILLDTTELYQRIGVTNTGVEILITHIQIFNPVKACFFLRGIQQSCLIPDQIKQTKQFFRTGILSPVCISANPTIECSLSRHTVTFVSRYQLLGHVGQWIQLGPNFSSRVNSGLAEVNLGRVSNSRLYRTIKILLAELLESSVAQIKNHNSKQLLISHGRSF